MWKRGNNQPMMAASQTAARLDVAGPITAHEVRPRGLRIARRVEGRAPLHGLVRTRPARLYKKL